MNREPVDAAWDVIEAELEAQFPAVRATLADPASDIEIARLERQCEVKLPPDFRASLKRHNGQRDRRTLQSFANGAVLLSVDGILDVWTLWHELAADPIHSVHPDNDTSDEIATDHVWHPKWIPFTDAEGNSHVLDLAPRSRGTRGQIFLHARSEVGDVLASSYTQWLERVALKLKNREFDSGAVADLHTPWFSGYDT